MKKIEISKSVKLLADEIAVRAVNESSYFPVDRLFLEPFMERILGVNPIEFILYNIEMVNPTYSNTLFLCLPELWENLNLNDFQLLIKSFSNCFSYFSLIEFSYKYLEVNIIELIISYAKRTRFGEDVKQYLKNQWHVLFKEADEEIELEQGIGKEFFKYDPNRWSYIKQKLLLNDSFTPAIQEQKFVFQYISNMLKSWV